MNEPRTEIDFGEKPFISSFSRIHSLIDALGISVFVVDECEPDFPDWVYLESMLHRFREMNDWSGRQLLHSRAVVDGNIGEYWLPQDRTPPLFDYLKFAPLPQPPFGDTGGFLITTEFNFQRCRWRTAESDPETKKFVQLFTDCFLQIVEQTVHSMTLDLDEVLRGYSLSDSLIKKLKDVEPAQECFERIETIATEFLSKHESTIEQHIALLKTKSQSSAEKPVQVKNLVRFSEQSVDGIPIVQNKHEQQRSGTSRAKSKKNVSRKHSASVPNRKHSIYTNKEQQCLTALLLHHKFEAGMKNASELNANPISQEDLRKLAETGKEAANGMIKKAFGVGSEKRDGSKRYRAACENPDLLLNNLHRLTGDTPPIQNVNSGLLEAILEERKPGNF